MIYIALFRGLNVGGNHKIKMNDLCAFLNAHGGQNTKHYIQSGNLVFSHNDDAEILAPQLEAEFEKTFGFSSNIVLRSLPQLEAAAAAYPFAQSDREDKFMMTGFARHQPNADALDLFKSLATAEELVAQTDREFFFYFGGGSARSKIGNMNFEKKIGTPVTVRNQRTVNKLIEIAKSF